MAFCKKKCALPKKLCTLLLILELWIVATSGQDVLCSSKMNVGFAVDGSNKMGEENFNTAIQFTSNVSTHLDVDINKTWIFLAYGDEKKVFKTNQSLVSLTPGNELFPRDDHVLLGSTLESAWQQFHENEAQRGAVNVLVLITAHKSDDDIAVPAVQLKKSHVTIFAIGLGTDYSVGQLKEIASDPDDSYFIRISNLEGLTNTFAVNIAQKICQVVDRCVSSPCRNSGTCTSFDDGYNCTCSPEFHGDNCEKSRSVEYLSLGCFSDDHQASPIPSLENGNATFLDGAYQTRENSILKCALEAAKMGYKVFALQDGGACHSGPDAHTQYIIHDNSSCPSHGKGDPLVIEVYLLGAKCGDMLQESLMHISNSTITGSSYNESWGLPLLNGSYSWCASDGDSRPQLKIDLERETLLTKVSLQGKRNAIHGVDNVCVYYTYEGVSHQISQDNLTCKQFGQQMSDKNGNFIFAYRLSPPLLVQSVSLAPTSSRDGGKCFRTGLRGCVTTVIDAEKTTEGCFETQRNKCCVFPFWYQGREVYSCIRDNHNQPWCATTDSYDRDQLWDNCQGISSPCDTEPCLNGGICQENLMDWSYQCSCSEHFINENCQDDFDECYNSLCQNGGTCVNTFGDYRCECNHGYSGRNCQLDCKFSEIELGFLMDSSASVEFYGASNFQMMKDFVKNLTSTFNVSSMETRVGVISYSTYSTLAFPLDQFSSYSEISEATDHVAYHGNGTNTGKALKEAATKLFKHGTVRSNVHKVLVVFTDGVSTDDVVQPSSDINKTGIIPFVLGVGTDYDLLQLNQIALGDSTRVFSTSFGHLGETVSLVRGAICREIDGCADNPCRFGGVCKRDDLSCTCDVGFEGPSCAEDVDECSISNVACGSGQTCTDTFGGYECTCAGSTYGENCTEDCSMESTVLFLLDSSRSVGLDNVRRQVEFIVSLGSTLSFRNIGVISYATDAHFVIKPGQSSNLSSFAERLRAANYTRGHTKNLGKALIKVMEETALFNSSRAPVVVAMVAGKAEDEHAVPAAILQESGVTILAVALGSRYSQTQLNHLATSPHEEHILKANFSDLKLFVSTARNKICQAANPCSSAQCSPTQICVNSYGRNGGYKCITHVCEPNPCGNGGNCTISGSGKYRCECLPGIGGENCTEDTLNECDSGPCINGGTCKDLLGAFECECSVDYSGRQCELGCVTQKFNLVFVVDGSGSIEYQGKGNFQRSKDFVIDIVRSFDIGKYDTNVAVVLYSSRAQVVFKLNKHYKKDDVVEAIEEMHYTGGGTKTGKALEEVEKKIFKGLKKDRKELPKVVIVLTDGLSQDDVKRPSQKLRDDGVIIISIGVGCCYDESELNEIATDPDEDHVLEVSFADLDKLQGLVRQRICSAVDFCSSNPCANGGNCTSLPTDFKCSCSAQWQGKDCETDVDECSSQITQCPDNQVCHNFPGGSTCLCTNNRYGTNCTSQCKYSEVDVAFLLDSSGSINAAGKENYQIMKDFIKGIVKSFIVSQNDTRIAVASFSSLGKFSVRFDFAKYSQTVEIIDAIQTIPYDGGLTFTGDALTRLRTGLFTRARIGVPQILIVLTDGRSHDKVEVPSKSLRDKGVHIISVGVGSAVNDQLEEIATDPDEENVFTASFDSVVSLVGSILEDVCRAVDHCLGNPCRNNGTCSNDLNDYKCTCPTGFSGKSCEDPCNPHPCYNGGTCSASGEHYKCDCAAAWTGSTCETEADQCLNSPCRNNGTCHRWLDVYNCTCPVGYTGQNCEVTDHCFNQPCSNGGKCHVSSDSFKCDCISGWMGSTCDFDVDECFNSPCIHGALGCRNTLGSYQCDCQSGFTGINCQIGILSNVFDVAFLFDGSSYVGVENFRRTLLFAQAVLSPFNISRHQTNVAAAVYASNCTISLTFQEHYSHSTVVTAIANTPFLDETPTNISNALHIVKTQIFTTGRDNVPDVLIAFVGDSLSGKFAEASQELRDQGIIVIVVGVGDEYHLDQLEEMASKPESDHVVTISYQDMDVREGIVCGAISQAVDSCAKFPCRNGGNCFNTLSNYTCSCLIGFEGPTCEQDIDECVGAGKPSCDDGKSCINTQGSYQCVCSESRYGENCQHDMDTKLDLAFLIDGSQTVAMDTFKSFLGFIKALTASLKVSKEGTHVGVAVSGDSAKLVIDFDDHYNQSSLGRAIDNIEYPNSRQSNMGEALSLITSSLYNTSSARPDATRVVVILLASICQDNVAVPSFKLQNYYMVNIFIVGVGNQYSLGQLKEIASSNDNVITIGSGIGLAFATSIFRETVAIGINHCSSSPCKYGTCSQMGRSYICNCNSGFSGRNCDKVNDPCNPEPCENNGACQVLGSSSYNCTCSAGWTGANCSEDIKECTNSLDVCQNGGACHEKEGDYSCSCEVEYAGKNCDKVCKEAVIDVAFMIDGSSSINLWGENNFAKIVNVTEVVMDNFNSARSRIGLVLFTTEPELKLNFNSTLIQRHQVLKNLSSLPGTRMTGEALNFTRELLFGDSRSDAHRVLVVFTHGTSNDAVKVASKLLHDMNVAILVVALGDWYDIRQVERIASNPDSKFLLKATFSDVESLTWRVHEMICEAVDRCFSIPCKNNGTCINLLEEYKCTCLAGFTGKNCEEELDPCLSSPCGNIGMCVKVLDGYKCMCPVGFTGNHCEVTVINPCHPQPCRNEGSCSVSGDSFICECADGWKGSTCDTDVDECFNNPCIHDALDCRNTLGSYECICSSGFTGIHCQIQVPSTKIDLAFLFDGSSYIGSGNFSRTLLIAKSILTSYNISKEQTNVAAAVYANSAIVSFNFTEHYSLPTVSTAIESVPFLDETPLNIGNALAMVKSQIFDTDRDDVPDVLVIFVSEMLTNNSIEVLQELREEDIIVIVVGVGNRFDEDQLKTIASKPESDYVITVSFQHMDTMEGAISGAISQAVDSCAKIPCRHGGNCTSIGKNFTCACPTGFTGSTCQQDVDECKSAEAPHCDVEKTCINTLGNYECVCSGDRYGQECQYHMDTRLDLAFLIDGSQDTFISFLYFTKAVTASLNVSKEETHVGVATYGDNPNIEINFDDHHNQSSLEQAIDSIKYPDSWQSNMGEALSHIAAGLYNNSRVRPNATRVLVILAASTFQDDVAHPSYKLVMDHNVTIFTVAVGDLYSLGQLKEIASNPDSDHIVTVSSGEDLSLQTANFKETMAIALDHCSSNPCQKGNCSRSEEGFICSCYPGFLGEICDKADDPCLLKPCKNNGTCQVQGQYSYVCTCSAGWIGVSCDEVAVANPCHPQPCRNGASCYVLGDSFICDCADGWKGSTCDTDVDECFNSPCIHDALGCRNTLGSYECTCSSGFTGIHCQIKVPSTKIDLAFLFDGSSYIGSGNFSRTLLIAKSILTSYNISKEQTNVAAAVYANSAIVSFNFTEHYNLPTVSTAIESVPFLDETPLNIGNALAIVKSQIFDTDRDDIPDVLVIFVSEMLTNNSIEVLQELREEDIIVIVVGVGNRFDEDQLKTIASKPESDYVITVSFQHMDTMEGAISGAISQAVDSCAKIPCRHGGNCTRIGNNFICACPTGFTGPTCEQDVDECKSAEAPHCDVEKTCINTLGNYECVCSGDRYGQECQYHMDTKLDLAFLIDGSQDTFISFLYFIKAVTASLNVSKEETHVGVVTYGDTPSTEITFDDYYNQSSLEQAIDGIKYPDSWQSNMGEALSHIASGLYNNSRVRPNATRVLVILTASISQDNVTLPSYKLAIDHSVTVFAVAVGDQNSFGQLSEIASNPDSDHIVTVSSEEDLSLQTAIFKDTMAIALDHCTSNPCQKGNCSLSEEGFICSCYSGFSGELCDKVAVANPCHPQPCRNGASCYVSGDSFICDCADGWKGSTCDTDVDECFNSPCIHDALSCRNTLGSYECTCSSGFTGIHCQIQVPSTKIDLAFLFDGSSYIGSGNFSRTLLIAKSILTSYNISKEQTNVAAAVYANSAIVSFNFTEHYNLPTVSTAIESVPFLDETPLNIGNALVIVKSQIFDTDRDDVPDVLVIFVSEMLTNNSIEVLQELREEDIIVIVVGVGNKFDEDQLKTIASKPESDYVITVSFQHMDTMEGAISGAISQAVDSCAKIPCRHGGNCTRIGNNFTCACPTGFTGPTCEQDVDECKSAEAPHCDVEKTCINTLGNYECVCSGDRYGQECQYHMDTKLDLAFLIDGSRDTSVMSFLYFIKAVTASLSVSKEETHVGVATYGDTPSIEITFDDYYNQSSLEQAIDGIKYPDSWQSNMGEALSHIASGLYNNSRVRPNATRVLVILTASISQDNVTLPSYKLAIDHSVTVFAVAVGDQNSLGQLSEIASNPDSDHIVTVSSEEDLSLQTAIFKDTMAIALDHCTSNPCQKGNCSLSEEGFICSCYSGFSGELCDKADDPCLLKPCKNNGTCQVQGQYFYVCTCSAGWTGLSCDEVAVANPCHPQPCRNGASCYVSGDSFICDCADGWKGSTCDTDVDECFNSPCIHDALSCRNTLGSYECTCSSGFTGIHCQIKVPSTKIDLAFLFDGSSYIGSGNFSRTLLIAKSILTSYNISKEQTNVAAAVYANSAIVSFNFTEHYSLPTVSTAIESVPFLDETPLNIGNALAIVKSQIFDTDRDDVPDVLVIFVSEMLTNNSIEVLQELREEDVIVIVVGVGNKFDEDQLKTIASKPESDYVFTVSFQHMDTMEGAISGAISQAVDSCATIPCRHGGNCTSTGKNYTCACPTGFTGPTCEEDMDACKSAESQQCGGGKSCIKTLGNYECVCSGDRYGQECQYHMDTKLDLAFLIDGSRVVTKDTFNSFLYFIKAVAASLIVSKEETHVGVATYGDTPSIEITFDDHHNQSSLEQAIDGIKYPDSWQSNMGEALSHIASGLYNNSRVRPNATRVLVILTASTSQDDVAHPSYKLVMDHNVTIFTVAVGDRYSLGQLKEIASNPDSDHIVTVSSGEDLSLQTAIFKETMAIALDHCSSNPCQNGNCSHSEEGFTCSCYSGFSGKNCDKADDPCHSDPCKNNGSCKVLAPSFYNCTCSAGWIGANCDEVDHCSLNPCRNNGTCHNNVTDYKCSCLPGAAGKNCEVADLCYLQPCKNAGTCTFSGNTSKCDCTSGWTGLTCEIDVDECFNSPCLHEASSCRNTLGSYECDCASGYTGIHCQIGIPSNVFDIAFLFDGSSQVGADNFRRTLDFANAILSYFNISRQQTNVAAAVYADNTIISFNFIEHYEASTVSAAIKDIPFLDETPPNITKALNTAKTKIFVTGRDNIPDILVVFVSDTLKGNFTAISQELRHQGVTIITVGVGDGYDLDHLEEICSEPEQDFVVTVSFQHMDTMEGVASGAVSQAADRCAKFPCRNGGNCSTTGSNYTCACAAGYTGPTCEKDVNECTDKETSTCSHGTSCVNTRGGYQCLCIGRQYGEHCQYEMDTKLDIVFLIDGSQGVTKDTFWSFLFFVKAFTASLNVSHGETHVAVAVYGGTTNIVIGFEDHHNQSSLDAAIDNILYPGHRQSNLGEALSHIAFGLYNSSAARPNVKPVLVILTASTSQDDIVLPSFNLVTYHQVTVFAIGIGVQFNLGQLKEVASSPSSDHVLSLNSGLELSFQTVTFKDTLAKALDPCSSKPCHNGTCSLSKEGYNCSCYSGFSGRHCQKENDPCSPDPCKNNGTCQDLPLNSYYCTCPIGWTGVNCDEDIKECSIPFGICQNGGTCHERMGDYSCSCAIGYAGKNCDKVCRETKMDLALLIDGSSSLNYWQLENYEKIINAAELVLNYFTAVQSRIGVVLYAAQSEVKITFNSTINQRRQIPMGFSSSRGRMIGKALNFTREELFVNSRFNAHRVLIVVTTGTSNDAVAVASKLLRDMNVTILVVALGDWYDIRQVEAIASDPGSRTTLTAEFSELDHLSWRVHKMICEAVDHCVNSPCRNNGTCENSMDGYKCSCLTGFTGQNCEEVIDQCKINNTCRAGQVCISGVRSHDCVCPEEFYGKECNKACNTTVDLVFLVDGTEEITDVNFKSSLHFVRNLVRVSNLSLHGTHVGLVVYGQETDTVFNLTDYFSVTSVDHAVGNIKFSNRKRRSVGKALRHVRDNILRSARSGVPKVLIVLQGKRSWDGIGGISQEIRKSGVRVFGVGNGNQMAEGQLKEMSSKPTSHYYKSVGYDAINTAYFVQQMKESICMALDPCSALPCLNNGSCLQQEDEFSCVCSVGYTGFNCNKPISPCSYEPCKNGGQCSPSGGSYRCNCKAGFTSENCQDDINECDANPCQNNAECKNTPGSYHCVCPQGYLGINCHLVCKHQEFNLVFLIDSSASVKNLVSAVINFYRFSQNGTNVGIVMYSSYATTIFTLSSHSELDINKGIDTMNYPNGANNIGMGLTTVRTELFANAHLGMPNCLVVVTDGVSNDDISMPSAYLKAMKVVTMTVGVGGYYAKEELDEMASSPDSSHMFQAPSYDDLPSTATKLKESICNVVDHCFSSPCSNEGKCESQLEGYRCVCPLGYTGANCEIDINECLVKSCGAREICVNFPGTFFCNCRAGYFNMERSCQGEYTKVFNIGFVMYNGETIDQYRKGNFRKQIAFVKGLAQSFNIANNDTTVGVITYSDKAVVRYKFNDVANQSELEVALDNLTLTDKGRNVGKALELARTDLFNGSSLGRNNSTRNILVVITDGSSEDDLAVASYASKGDNVTIFSIGIDRYVRGQLNEMASEPDSQHVFTADSYDDLGPIMAALKDAIIKDVEPCATFPCLNNGTCDNPSVGNYRCTCSSEWTGKHCEIHDSPCTVIPPPCNRNGNCSVSEDRVLQCTCAPGWNGTQCENDINECLQSPCLNDGNCTNTLGSYFCQCPVKSSGDNCEIRCEAQAVNIGFLLDGSASMKLSGSGNFNKSLEFIKSLIAGFNVSKEETNVGFAVFSSEYHHVFSFGHFNNSADAIAAVNDASYPNQGRQTGKALNYVRHEMFSESNIRENVSNYLVVITTGATYDLLKTPAKKLRDKNITIFAVGVGKDYDVEQLKDIAGDNGSRVYTVAFTQLEVLKNQLKKEICLSENTDKCSSAPCFNGGLCINMGRRFRCECSRGYYGRLCQFGCGFRELGIKVPSNRRIPDKDITSSSQRSEGRAAYRGRVGVETMGEWEDGWCSSEADLTPYFQVCFGYLTNVSVIETEGVTDVTTGMWVESYYVSMSNESDSESFVNYTEEGKTKVFNANDNIDGKNNSLRGPTAHCIRIHPVNYKGSFACLRIALYGCDTEDFPSAGVVLERINNSPMAKQPIFDTRLAAIPIVLFIALMSTSMFLFIRSLRQRPFKKRLTQGYSMMQHEYQEEAIYQTIPFELPMYEVQTVTMEMGPDHTVEMEGMSTSSSTTYSVGSSSSSRVQNYEYHVEEEELYDTVFSSEISMYEEQTLTVDMGSEYTVGVDSIFSQENKIFGFNRQINT